MYTMGQNYMSPVQSVQHAHTISDNPSDRISVLIRSQ